MHMRRAVADMARTQAVLFDISGVLVTARLDPSRIAELLGLDPAEEDSVALVDHAVWFNRPAYDSGSVDDRRFWDTVAGDCGLPEVGDDRLADLVAEDVARMSAPDAPAIQLAAELRDEGYRLGILANAPVCIAEAIRTSLWAQGMFDAMTFSGPLRIVKPSQGIYRQAGHDLGVDPARILVLDDRRPNLRGAELAGMSGLLWETPQQVREDLIERGVLRTAQAS